MISGVKIPAFKRDAEQKYYRAVADVFSATVLRAGDVDGQWIVQPHVIEVNGEDAPEMPALAGDAIKPADGNIVLCVTSRNNYDHVLQNRANRSTGANLIIVAVFSDELTRDAILNITKTLNVGGDFNLTGDATLGLGTQKMVLGESLAAWAAAVDAAIVTLNANIVILNAWGLLVAPPLPTPLAPLIPFPFLPTNLSQRHKLD